MSPHNVTVSSANRKVLPMNRFKGDDPIPVKIGKYKKNIYFRLPKIVLRCIFHCYDRGSLQKIEFVHLVVPS